MLRPRATSPNAFLIRAIDRLRRNAGPIARIEAHRGAGPAGAGLSCLTVLLLATGWAKAAPALRVLRHSNATTEVLRNGNFELSADNDVSDWRPWQAGFRVARGEGIDGGTAIRCVSDGSGQQHGISQTITLDQSQPVPLTVSGFSRCQSVTGAADSGYSIYVDLIYRDGTPLWGQTGNFRCGTHAWEQTRFVILPAKPVRSLTVHCLFRGHTGTVWFDAVSVAAFEVEGDAHLFQNVPVQRVGSEPSTLGEPWGTWNTTDGLRVAASRQGALRSFQVGDLSTGTAGPAGLLARDAAADSDFYVLPDGDCPELQLRTQFTWRSAEESLTLEGRITDLTRQDRAITLAFALPVEATGWQWGDDFRRSRPIQGRTEYVHQAPVGCGSTGGLSLYPVGAVWNDRYGLALALDPAVPAVYRVGYHAGLRVLFIAHDFGLVTETEAFPSAADFRLVIFRFDPRWGFRAAWEKYMRLFPEAFRVRTPRQGLWMPFTDVALVPEWKDFGFRFHEGDNNVAWDDEHDVLSFRYTEPMTWWMPMPDEAPRTLESALRIRDTLAQTGSPNQRRMAAVTRIAAMEDEHGEPQLRFRNEPWCRGAVWSLNPNPHLEEGDGTAGGGSSTNAATVHWNSQIRDSLYGPGARGRRDGEYLDSLEGYVTAELNFRRDHFRATTVPLTFAGESHRPALFKGLAVCEFTRWMAEDLHRMGKLTFANSVPYRFTFLCPWLDVMGTETDWMPGGQYRPSSDEQMLLWRGLAGRKPYLLLMNTDYDRFTPDLVERYFQRALFYGMWPGFFSHNAAEDPYWKNPKWYERDRPLFRRYLPSIRRVAEAGWQPVTHATCDPPAIHLERFGPSPSGEVYLTLHNEGDAPVSGRVRIDAAALDLPAGSMATELVGDRTFPWPAEGWPTTLDPHTTQVVQLRPP